MPVFESKYINSDADYLNLTQMNHNASTLQAHMKPCQLALEIPDISEGLNKRAVITDESGNYLRVAMLSDLEDYYTKDYIDDALSNKSDTDHTHSELYAGGAIQLKVNSDGIIEFPNGWGMATTESKFKLVRKDGESWIDSGYELELY